MSSKEVILGRIRAALKDVTVDDPIADQPVEWTYGLPDDFITDVVGTFVENVEDYKATVLHTDTSGLPATIATALTDRGAKSVVLPAGIPDTWRDAIADAGLEIRYDDPPLTNYELDETDAVVTGSCVSIADSGTVILNHDPDQGRRALSLVPDLHICGACQHGGLQRAPGGRQARRIHQAWPASHLDFWWVGNLRHRIEPCGRGARPAHLGCGLGEITPWPLRHPFPAERIPPWGILSVWILHSPQLTLAAAIARTPSKVTCLAAPG